MKKLITGLILILLLSLPVSASAASAVSFETTDVFCRADRVIEVNVKATCDKKLSAAIFSFQYDKTVLEFRKATAPSGAQVAYNEASDSVKVSYLCSNGADIRQSNKLFTLTFKTLKNGSSDIGFTVKDCVDSDVQSMTIGNCTAGKVTVSSTASDKVGTVEKSSSKYKTSSQKSTSGKQQKSTKAKTKATKATQETTTAIKDLGKVNNILHNDSEKLTPLIILCASIAIAAAFIGYIVFKIKTYKENKKKDSP